MHAMKTEINQCLDIVLEYSEKLKSSKDKSAPNYGIFYLKYVAAKKIDEAEKYYNKGVLLSKKY